MTYRACLLTLLVACGGSSSSTTDANDPTNVPFGTTAIVVVVNPVVNTANMHTGVPPAGTVQSGVTLTTDDGVMATTGASGIAILAPVTAGARTITVTGTGVTGTFTVMVAAGALHEVAIAADASGTQRMLDVDYKTDQAVHLDPTMSNTQVNDALRVSDRVVFMAGGTYTGDIDFGGSRVTLFGEGALGGKVMISGNVTVSGSDSRIRGTEITGTFTVPASGVGLTFSHVHGATTSQASDGMYLANALCGTTMITGSGTYVLGNAGLAPTTTCP